MDKQDLIKEFEALLAQREQLKTQLQEQAAQPTEISLGPLKLKGRFGLVVSMIISFVIGVLFVLIGLFWLLPQNRLTDTLMEPVVSATLTALPTPTASPSMSVIRLSDNVEIVPSQGRYDIEAGENYRVAVSPPNISKRFGWFLFDVQESLGELDLHTYGATSPQTVLDVVESSGADRLGLIKVCELDPDGRCISGSEISRIFYIPTSTQ
jgi:hypothetical protein